MDASCPRRSGRGGSRSPADRVSSELSANQCEAVTEGAWEAVRLGRSLNRYITINWSTAGVATPLAATSQFLKAAGDWLRSHGIPLAFVWTRENYHGDHVHLLIHVPPQLARGFTRRQRGWLKALGAKTAKGVIDTTAVGRHYRSYEVSPVFYALNLDYVLRYLLKGASSDGARFTDHRRCPCGDVTGKRSGVSVYLGRHRRTFRAM